MPSSFSLSTFSLSSKASKRRSLASGTSANSSTLSFQSVKPMKLGYSMPSSSSSDSSISKASSMPVIAETLDEDDQAWGSRPSRRQRKHMH
ncbi:hypothetical protein PUNSTDRAFT_129112 [Punctularia strigosozonata HHB-11173 SS5]|uniref:uncharacterized protein n=1 Tax=Punctularia strigosozonata (strain HHB-11173) TaxID=741275 RepID=UPI0004417B03|nr:uncharacterized protein PUNSTDRAFT_129111 [Punctularia strigosozonata HHB-11173 SS5]XP_007378343.1 uncharacterized protein PUNSTDRAFT_129112 [Punctularia strigosozonata HHB-11173 SS5]EIN13425.1 hypothetical protein PUNSTDRAFT_129111 [Punctularia strigosozonata HHB-11173 SS5]EIN13426.1 hypothetical protein PUNSTDRAFT_129112 [Punctularia strigosozonata HHB-11173 SS5]